MALKKSLMVAGAVATIGLAGTAAGVQAVSAESNTSTDNLVDKIAQKFNLNKDDVQKVFDENRQAKEAEHKTAIEQKLSTAVSEGKLTEDQKSKILAKMDELQKEHETNREQFKNMTEEQRRSAMETKRNELEQWAKDNNIPTEYLFFVHVKGGPGPGPGRGFGDKQPL